MAEPSNGAAGLAFIKLANRFLATGLRDAQQHSLDPKLFTGRLTLKNLANSPKGAESMAQMGGQQKGLERLQVGVKAR